MRTILLATALALAAPVSTLAQPVSEAAGPDTYLVLELGAVVPAGEKAGLDTGFTLGGRFGARFTDYLAAEAGVAYQRAEGSGGAWLRDLPVAVSLVARLPLKQAELAAYAGADLHFARRSPGTPFPAATDTVFGGHLGARAAFKLWPTTLVGLDVRCAVWEASFDGPGVSSFVDLKLLATLQYRF